jgi:DNA-directed RNA polymerase specialized sigma24 family protein
MSNSATEPNANELRPFTLEHLNAAILSGREQMLACYIDNAIGIYCNITGKSVGPRPKRMSEYSGSYGDAYYIACNAVYEVWTRIGGSYDPSREFKPYYETVLRNEISDILKSGGRTDLLSQPARSKSRNDAFNKLSRVDADGYWGDSGSEPDNTDPDRQERVRQFMSDELDALIRYLDSLPEKERTVFLASDFGRAFSPSPDKYGRDYAEALAEKYHTSAGYIRKLAALQKKKALEAIQKQGFNKRAFTAIELIQAKPGYTETYDKVMEATEKLTPFEQFMLLKHIEDMKEENKQAYIQEAFSDSMEIIDNENRLSAEERRLIGEVLGFMFTESICFQDYRDVLVMELSPKAPPTRTKEIDRSDLEAELKRLIAIQEGIRKEYLEAQGQSDNCFSFEKEAKRKRAQELQEKLGILGQMTFAIQKLLEENPESIIDLSMNVLGEFVPSPSPKVVLYLRGYESDDPERYKPIVSTLVHELFHAVNFFKGEGNRSLRELDEPMVEFAAGVFLKALSEVKEEFAAIYDWHKRDVARKASGIGEIACYGFGRYLMDNVAAQSSFSEREWIETYASRSASIENNNPDAFGITENLYPCYPVADEKRVLRDFESVIFRNFSPVSRVVKEPESQSHLKVIRKDGSVLEMDTDEATFVLAILEAGITRVCDLKLPAYERYLVNDKYDAGKSKFAAVQYYEPITGLYIQQHFAPERQMRYLEHISESFGLGWTVEYK